MRSAIHEVLQLSHAKFHLSVKSGSMCRLEHSKDKTLSYLAARQNELLDAMMH